MYDVTRLGVTGVPDLYSPQFQSADQHQRMADVYNQAGFQGGTDYQQALAGYHAAKDAWKNEAKKQLYGGGGDMAKANSALSGAAGSLVSSL